MNHAAPPVVLDIDDSVGPLPGECRLPLHDWQEAVRFGCGLPRFRRFADLLDARMPAFGAHGTVFMGSGDFHHLSGPLVARCIAARAFTAHRPLRIVVLDNHPDNMRFPFGIHCGSWVRHAALLPQVSQVHVVGITSGDIGRAHAWENYLQPLRTGKLRYWSTGVDTRWSRWLGLGAAFRGFPDGDALVETLCATLAADPQPTYLSIDKDAFAPDVVRTNWDQGVLRADHADAVIGALRGQMAGCDVTGEVSSYRYTTAWKRWLSAGDGQQTEIAPDTLRQWQAGQDAFNQRLLEKLKSVG
ncbi:hypothetical protein ACFX58_13575 [Sphingomonas sp. NCPPB 2930]